MCTGQSSGRRFARAHPRLVYRTRRSDRLYFEVVDNALTAQLPFIKAIFRKFSGRNLRPGDKKPMCCLEEWLELATKARAHTHARGARATPLTTCACFILILESSCLTQSELLSERFTQREATTAFIFANMTCVSARSRDKGWWRP